jgi:hypothetical protein
VNDLESESEEESGRWGCRPLAGMG